MIPGVGQREEFPLKSHQQQIVGPTLLNPAGTPGKRDFEFASSGDHSCQSLNKLEVACICMCHTFPESCEFAHVAIAPC